MGDTPVGLIEKIGRFVIFRPLLRIEHEGERRVEDVAVRYPLGFYDAIDSPGSTMPVTGGSRFGDGHSRYVRVWIYNALGFPAHRCRVFVERIWLDGKIIEEERSPLHWADRDGLYELPEEMPWKRANGAYVDVCASDSIDNKLRVISQKWIKGYHRFVESGRYKIELSAECARPCWRGHFALTVSYDARKWDALRVVSTKECKRFMGWAWSAN
jgi:hypothetical protein